MVHNFQERIWILQSISIIQLWNYETLSSLASKFSKLGTMIDNFKKNKFPFWSNFQTLLDFKLPYSGIWMPFEPCRTLEKLKRWSKISINSPKFQLHILFMNVKLDRLTDFEKLEFLHTWQIRLGLGNSKGSIWIRTWT